MNIAPVIAALAVIPLATGPQSHDEPNALIVALCDGGTISIPLGDDEAPDERDCHSMACHAGVSRHKVKKPI
ncbi:MAG: hypothetical protein AAFR88_00515 [Pseudomonadota bacterium]